MSFGQEKVRSLSIGRQGVGSPSYGRGEMGSSVPTYEFAAVSRAEPRYAMVSFESSQKSTATSSYSATYQLSDADPLPEATEKYVLTGSARSKSSEVAAASPSGSGSSIPSGPSATAGSERWPVPRKKIAMTVFFLVSASAIAITLLVQGDLRRRAFGDEGHEGTGTDPPLRLEKRSELSGDSAGFAMHFARRPTTEARTKSTPKQPPFLIVSLRPRTTTPSTEGPFTWPPYPETYLPWELDDSRGEHKNSSAEAPDTANVVPAAVVLEQQQPTDDALATALDAAPEDEQL